MYYLKNTNFWMFGLFFFFYFFIMEVRRYETSRWLLCGSMAVFCIHYFLQMTQGFRAQGADVGAVVNIMFYTPVVFAITLSIINMESTRSVMRRYCLRSAAAYAR